MAFKSYIRGGANAVKKGLSTVGSYLLKPVDAYIEKDKKMVEARRERDRKMIEQNFGSVEKYEALQREEVARQKRIAEEKEKSRKKQSYVK